MALDCGMSTNDQETRCVLLASAANGAVAREQLDARGWIAHMSSDPLPALAELCLLERLDSTRRTFGRSAGAIALVVVEPSRWPQLQAMLSAARRYVPTAALWAFDNGALIPLAVAEASDNGAGRPGRAGGPNAAPPMAYELPTASEAPTAADDDETGSPRITGDEISMLLDGKFRDEQIPEPPEPPETPETGDKPATDPEA